MWEEDKKNNISYYSLYESDRYGFVTYYDK